VGVKAPDRRAGREPPARHPVGSVAMLSSAARPRPLGITRASSRYHACVLTERQGPRGPRRAAANAALCRVLAGEQL